MLTYIQNKDEKLCCGCRACEQICPKQAISMQKNSEGFFYPVLNEAVCVNCGLCEKVCPMMNRPDGEPFKAVYAVQHNDEEILKDSSSGGVFRLLADEVIRNGGYVVGCVWNECYQPVLRIAHSLEELMPMQGSKYLSSDTNTVYAQVKKLLDEGKTVLFTGTPCQCAGILKFLRKPYENLLTADFLCHGVPSQLAFDSYLDAIEKRHRIRPTNAGGALCPPTEKDRKNSSKVRGITSYKFRDKEKRGWGHVSTYTWTHGGKARKHYAVGMTDPYDFGFLNGYFNRYSCYTCPFRGGKRFTDFTFCDYWGIERYHDIDSHKGVSAVSINSERAESYIAGLKDKALWVATEAKNVAVDNPALLHIHEEHIPDLRFCIYDEIKTHGWPEVEKKYLICKNSIIKKVWYSVPCEYANLLKRILRKLR